MTTLGAIFPPDVPPERLRDVATSADRAGLEQLWIWEDCFKESGIATAAAHDPTIDGVISAVVATDIIARVAGKRLATTVARRVPVVGGVVGMGADGFATWRIGRYADRELLPRGVPGYEFDHC